MKLRGMSVTAVTFGLLLHAVGCQLVKKQSRVGAIRAGGEFVMTRSSLLRLVVLIGSVAVLLSGCSRDPNVRKQKYFESGQRYFAEGKYREAVIQFRNATQVDGTFADAHYQLAQSYLKLQDFTHAYSELGRTLELQPDNYKAHADIANLLIAGSRGENGANPEQVRS